MADSVCACEQEFRSVCEGLPADNEHEGNQYCVLHFPSAGKDLAQFEEAIERKLKADEFDFRGVYFPSSQSLASFLPNGTFEGVADFSKATFAEEANFRHATFRGKAHFTAATFEEGADFFKTSFEGKAGFYETTFKKRAIFTQTTFKGEEATFYKTSFEGKADFFGTTFEGPVFIIAATFEEEARFSMSTDVRGEATWTTFKGEAHFTQTTFKKRADFAGTTFKTRANFARTIFEGEADFRGASFEWLAYLFSETIFKDGGKFWSLQTSLQTFLGFRAAVIENPERFSFHSTYLRPSWFIDVDAQKFNFSDVEWFRLPEGDELTLEKEIEAVEARGDGPPEGLHKFQKTCRQLMNNAEENRDYPTANEFHYWSMELLRKESWWRRLGLIGTLYWASSGYGDRPRRAFLVLVGMWALFVFLYVIVAGSIEHVGEAFLYSLAAMVRLTNVPAMAEVTTLLQPSEPGLFQVLVTAEGILGPLQNFPTRKSAWPSSWRRRSRRHVRTGNSTTRRRGIGSTCSRKRSL